MKKILQLAMLLMVSAVSWAQSTSVSATVSDTSGQTWNNGTYAITFVPVPNKPGPYFWNGAPFTGQTFQGNMDGFGTFSVSIPDNSFITPAGSQWRFTVCPQASFQCHVIVTAVNGASLSLTSAISTNNPPIRFTPTTTAYGYSDSEPLAIPGIGQQYFNVTTKAPEYWDGTEWVDFPTTGTFIESGPATTQTITQPVNTNLNVLTSGTGQFTYNGSNILTAASGTPAGTAVLLNPSSSQTVTEPVNDLFNFITSGTGVLSHNGNPILDTTSGIQVAPAGTQSITQPASTSFNPNIENTVYYAGNFSSLQTAINAACNGTLPGSVVLPVGTITLSASLTIPSNCTITGQGMNRSIVQANTTMNAPLITTTSTQNIILSNYTIDGNRAANSNVFDCLDITLASGVTLDGMGVRNCFNNGVLIFAGSSRVNILNGEFYNMGPASPTTQGTAAISLSSGAESHILISNNSIHDSSGGIQITNSSAVGQDVSGVLITGNRIYSNANDGIIATTSTLTGANITGLAVEGNEIFCNGWPANGTGFSANCTPGLQQTGSGASQGGVGVDLIQQGTASVIRPIVSGNVIHDNVFEAVSPTTNINPIVNASGTTLTWVSGPKFSTALVSGQSILVNGTAFIISSVSSNTSLTTTTSMGTLTGVSTNFPGYMGAIISNNNAFLDGNGTEGPCFYNAFSDGNAYSGNVATNCNMEGFEVFYSSANTFSGDRAYGNGTSNTGGRKEGFHVLGGFGNSFIGISTNDYAATPTQTVGIQIDPGSVNNLIQGQAILAATPITNNGTSGTVISIGDITAVAYFAGVNAGVTCSGTPTASFASINGIVTHC